MSFLSPEIDYATRQALKWDGNHYNLPNSIDNNLKFRASKGENKLLFLKEEVKKIDNCKTCGCYGLASEFFKPHFCVSSCYQSSVANNNQNNNNQNNIIIRNAPLKLFKRPALPSNLNPFCVGQMLEAIDPENQSLFCVVSIVNIVGWRLELHFEGFPAEFDFFVNADSLDIFPAGWCDENGIELQTPPGRKNFNWPSYLMDKKSNPAPRHYFQITKETPEPLSTDLVGMKLEAVDIRNPNNLIICVATVTKVLGDRFLIHFDSWDNIYDYWADLTCPFIFPVGHCHRNKIKLTPPNNFKIAEFKWEEYLSTENSVAMPMRLFQPLPPVGFKKGMRIEAVDLRCGHLIRPSIISSVEGHMLTVHYEGWSEIFDVKFTELSSDIHPIGYCEHTGHPLETIPTTLNNNQNKYIDPCPNLCEWKGSKANRKNRFHTSRADCPYLFPRDNLERVIILQHGRTTSVLVGSDLPITSAIITTQQNQSEPEAPKKMPRPAQKLQTKKQEAAKKMEFLARRIILEKQQKSVEKYIFQRKTENLSIATVKKWNCKQVCDFVKSLPGCQNVGNLFLEQLIDGDAFLLLNKNDLKSFAKFGQAVKISYAISLIK